MKTINCTNSNVGATFMLNGGNADEIIVFAIIDDEYWFEIGWFKTINGAKRSAIKQLARHGYNFDEKDIKNLTIENI